MSWARKMACASGSPDGWMRTVDKGRVPGESPAFCYGSSTGERESEIVRLQRKIETSFRVFMPSSEAYNFVDKREPVKNFE